MANDARVNEPERESLDESSGHGGVLAFVPSLNDHQSIQAIEAAVASWQIRARVLIIDDGSREPIQAHPNSLVFRLPDNFGLGVCTQIALDHALRMGYRALVRIDADGQHPVAAVPALLSSIDAGEADVVVGVRSNHAVLRDAGGILRTLVKKYFEVVASLVTAGNAPRDVNTGFFALNRTAMKVLNRYEFERFPEPQLFVLACRRGLRVREFEIQQLERSSGQSTLSGIQAMRMLWRFNIFVVNELLGPRESR
ncbi:MAG: glycosyltransferase family 2 protein [Alphaproteobacteria bacterium]|nr:glycosyltransferase family 2 protein [Alphaproteobacteria bacterium]